MFKHLHTRLKSFLNIQMGLWTFVLLLQMFVPAHGTIHTLQSSDLPITIGTSYNSDTIRIAGTRIVTAGSGILVGAGVHDVLFDFGTDTLEFGTAGGNNAYGMRIYGSGGDNARDIIVSGGHILRNVGPGIADGSDNHCLRLGNAHDIQFLGTDFTIDGHDAQCVIAFVCYNINFEGGTWTSNSRSFTSRHNFDGAVLYSEYFTRGLGDYGFRMYGVTVANGPCQGIIVMTCKAIIDSCTITTDHVNDYGSDANQYLVFCRNAYPGTQITNNRFISGTSRGGSRGVGMDNSLGTESDPFVVRDNVFNLHNGPDPENGGGVLRGIRIRAFPGSATGYINVVNNTLIATVDNNPATTWIGNEASAIQVTVYDYDVGHVRVDSNIVYARSLSSGTTARAFQMTTENVDPKAKGTTTNYNQFYSCNNIMHLNDQYNGEGCQDAYFARNTLGFIDTTVATGDPNCVISNPRTWLIGYDNRVSTGNVSIDGFYVNGASEEDINWYGTPANGSRDLGQRRTVRVYVQGENLEPVVNAQVKIENALGNTIASGNTNENGRFIAAASYWFESDVAADSTNLNPFQITAWYGSDTTIDNSFIVGYLQSQGRDTLTLSLTTGTGVWLDDSADDTPYDDDPQIDVDTVPPSAVIDLDAN